MAEIKKKLAHKAVKSTAKHTAHGTVSKLKRDPLRTATLLGVGTAVGALVGWLLTRAATAAPSVQAATSGSTA